MTEQLELVAESLARRTDSRRTFIGRLAKAGFVAFAGLAAGIPSSMLVEAGSCSFPHGACTNCPADGCPRATMRSTSRSIRFPTTRSTVLATAGR